MEYTLQQLSTMIDALTARVNTIDGQGLAIGQVSSLANLSNRLNGLKTDLSQLALTFENQLSIINQSIVAIQTQITNLSNPS